MKKLELRLEKNQYIIISDGHKSSTMFSDKFRMMAINKLKFLAKNALMPITIIVEDENGIEIMNQEVNERSTIDLIK